MGVCVLYKIMPAYTSYAVGLFRLRRARCFVYLCFGCTCLAGEPKNTFSLPAAGEQPRWCGSPRNPCELRILRSRGIWRDCFPSNPSISSAVDSASSHSYLMAPAVNRYISETCARSPAENVPARGTHATDRHMYCLRDHARARGKFGEPLPCDSSHW